MPHPHIAIITRLPIPGHTKTRLIPALGADGAARLHAQLIAHTLAAADAFAENTAARITVWVDAPADEAAAVLGTHRTLAQQPAGDLGARMTAAFDAAFADGAGSAVAIGSDCPRLDASVLAAAFRELETADAVIGPAADGGYYLIGFTADAWGRARETVFSVIPWSGPTTAEVQREKLATAGLTIAGLPKLADIDEPGDLPEWEASLRDRA